MFIQTEATPNPATLKFLPGRAVLETGTLDLRDAADAAKSPLAERLFAIKGVNGVFYGSDFITVSKADGEWPQLKPAILGAIMEHFMSGAPLLKDGETGRHEPTTSSSRRPTRRSSPPSRTCSRRGCGRRSPTTAATSPSRVSRKASSICI